MSKIDTFRTTSVSCIGLIVSCPKIEHDKIKNKMVSNCYIQI